VSVTYDRLHIGTEPEEKTMQELGAVLAVLGESSGRVTRNFLRRCLANPSTRAFVARAPGGQIVGTVFANLVFTGDDIEGRLDNVAVLDTFRGQGIARKLLDRAIGYCTHEGAIKIELTCATHREIAGKLYESLGFVERPTRVYSLRVHR
jgi:ribosomal protein S18 acetylase RimI-like enzyme